MTMKTIILHTLYAPFSSMQTVQNLRLITNNKPMGYVH